jgi:hypothetical protein
VEATPQLARPLSRLDAEGLLVAQETLDI